ncbi:MAG: Zn-ribbon domain-containing OB-fold protein [Actinomycetota bacterium]
MSPRFEPPPSQTGEPFWAATKDHEFVIQHCTSCNRAIHYPRDICPHCHSLELEFRPASGNGEVYAFSVMHRPGNPSMQDRVPYVVALIDLDEGARMMSNVVGCEPAEVRVGMPVQVTWEDLSDGRALPLFEPRGES